MGLLFYFLDFAYKEFWAGREEDCVSSLPVYERLVAKEAEDLPALGWINYKYHIILCTILFIMLIIRLSNGGWGNVLLSKDFA